jgi:anti-sigma regulatory factor (Ser/Thr protein kinase)
MVSAELTGATPGHSMSGQPAREALSDADTKTLLEQGFDGDGLYALRSAVAAHVAAIADERTVDTMVLIAHELASNAVRHGGGTGRLRLWLADGALRCEVSDSGTGLPNAVFVGQSLPAPSLPGGRGLWIARQLSELHVASSPTGTTISATVAL